MHIISFLHVNNNQKKLLILWSYTGLKVDHEFSVSVTLSDPFLK